MIIEKVWFKNFKSLKNVEIKLGKFNLVVGPNGSGKTNLVDAFEFFKQALTSTEPTRPWRRWWSPENIAWSRDETLPLTFGLKLRAGKHTATYEATLTVAGGALNIIHEKLQVNGWATLEKRGNLLTITYDNKFVEKATKEGVEKEKLRTQEIEVEPQFKFLTSFPRILLGLKHGKNIETVPLILHTPTRKIIDIYAPKTGSKIARLASNLFNLFAYGLYWAIEEILVLRPLNVYALRKPQEFSKTLDLNSDGSNLYVVLYNLFLKRNALPEFIKENLEAAFPGYTLLFDQTVDGRIYVKLLKDDELELPPPCMPDGFHKYAAILAAVHLEPSILVIDELENSLHPQLVERIIDILRQSKTTVIATTHNPLVVDLTDPSDLLIAELGPSGTTFKRIRDPEKIKQELREHGITLSERWIWGNIKTTQ